MLAYIFLGMFIPSILITGIIGVVYMINEDKKLDEEITRLNREEKERRRLGIIW